MISSHPDPARRSYVPGLTLSAAGGASDTTTLFVSSSWVKARLSGETDGQPCGEITAVRRFAAPRARSHAGRPELESLEAPPGGRRDSDAVHTHGTIARVPDVHLDLQPLAGDDDPVIRRAVDRHARGGADRALEQAPLHRVRRGGAEESQRPGQIRQRPGGPPPRAAGAGRTDEGPRPGPRDPWCGAP